MTEPQGPKPAREQGPRPVDEQGPGPARGAPGPARKQGPEPARPPEPGVKSTPEPSAADGPVPVRDLMAPRVPAVEAEGEPRWEGTELGFEKDGVEWTVRTAGAGLYGTGDLGTARLLAVHFYREDRPERPVREALVPAGRIPHLRPEELERLFDRATPIEWDQ